MNEDPTDNKTATSSQQQQQQKDKKRKRQSGANKQKLGDDAEATKKSAQPPSGANDDPSKQQQPSTGKEDEEADDDLAMAAELDPEYERYMKSRNDNAQEQMRLLLEKMSPEQLERYETYRSASFPKATVKKLMQQILNGQSINERMAVMVAGVMKLYVGELVEMSRECFVAEQERKSLGSSSQQQQPTRRGSKQQNEDSATSQQIRPHHIRQAYRKLQQQQTFHSAEKRLF